MGLYKDFIYGYMRYIKLHIKRKNVKYIKCIKCSVCVYMMEQRKGDSAELSQGELQRCFAFIRIKLERCDKPCSTLWATGIAQSAKCLLLPGVVVSAWNPSAGEAGIGLFSQSSQFGEHQDSERASQNTRWMLVEEGHLRRISSPPPPPTPTNVCCNPESNY